MHRIPVWDIFVRVTHWAIAALAIGELTIFDEDWAIHRWAGYVILALVVLRLVWGLIGSRHARFSAFPPSLQAAREHMAGLRCGVHSPYLSHNPLGALMAYNLWASMIVAGMTGIAITNGSFWGISLVEGLHALAANWILVSVILHVGGIIFETRRSNVNLVRAMINGSKEIPGPGE